MDNVVDFLKWKANHKRKETKARVKRTKEEKEMQLFHLELAEYLKNATSGESYMWDSIMDFYREVPELSEELLTKFVWSEPELVTKLFTQFALIHK